MTEGIIDLLEIVDINVADSERMSIPFETVYFRFREIVKASPVSNSGQRIGAGNKLFTIERAF